MANSTLAGYLEGGGHWAVFLQYLLGLRQLGHDPIHLELLQSTQDRRRDLRLIDLFLRRFHEFGLQDHCAVVLSPTAEVLLERAEIFGMSAGTFVDRVMESDLLWNFAASLRGPLLAQFPRRVLIDLDPGQLQGAVLEHPDLEISSHHTFFTVGSKVNDADCKIPSLGHHWVPFFPFVHLPMWRRVPNPGPNAPFTSVTQWNWGDQIIGTRSYSTSKRLAYLRYVGLPAVTRRPFALAANIGPEDNTGEREILAQHGWVVLDPHEVAGSPCQYRDFIRRSRGELSCPKPIYRELRTGWLSDRTVCYLATGRPVVAEETGFSDKVPTGKGLISFIDFAEAGEAIASVDRDYAAHAEGARRLAVEYFDSDKCLTNMVNAS